MCQPHQPPRPFSRLLVALLTLALGVRVAPVLAADPAPDATKDAQKDAKSEPDDAPAPDGPPPVSGSDEKAVDGLPALKQLVEGGRLRLSLDQTSAADTFCFWLVAWVRTPQATPFTEIGVWRDRDHYAIWSWARQGQGGFPCCLATDGLFVDLDPKNPGGVVLFEGGHPEAVLSGDDELKGAKFFVGYRRDGGDPARVLFDAKRLIQSTYPTMVAASLDEKNKTIRVTTRRARMDIKPTTDPKMPCAVEYLGATGPKQAVQFRLSATPPDSRPRIDRLTAESVKGIPVPIRELSGQDADFEPYFNVPIADFTTDPRHRQAAERLWAIVRPPGDPRKQAPTKVEKTLPF